MEKFNKYDKENAAQHYDKLALNYDSIYQRAGYPDPSKCAEIVSELTEIDDLSKHDVKIMDFGCGTGLVGQALRENGFRDITGCDCSIKMLE